MKVAVVGGGDTIGIMRDAPNAVLGAQANGTLAESKYLTLPHHLQTLSPLQAP